MGLFKDLSKPHGIYFNKNNNVEYCPKCDGPSENICYSCSWCGNKGYITCDKCWGKGFLD